MPLNINDAIMAAGNRYLDTAYLTESMPYGTGYVYTRVGAATGRTVAGTIVDFAADAPQLTDRGLLLEPAGTNLALRSTSLATSPWSLNNVTIVADTTTAPDGTTTADKLEEAVAVSTHGVSQLRTVVSGSVYTQSCFAKAAERNFLVMTEGNNVTATAIFNLSTGVVVSATGTGSPSATITAFGDGWYRCTLTFTPIANSANIQVRASSTASSGSYLGILGSGIYAWGAQLELASASSPIATAAASATRSLPVFTEVVPIGRTKALLTYADASTTLVTGLTPGGTFDVAAAVVAASKGRFSGSELVTRVWQA